MFSALDHRHTDTHACSCLMGFLYRMPLELSIYCGILKRSIAALFCRLKKNERNRVNDLDQFLYTNSHLLSGS